MEVVVRKERSRKAKLSIYHLIYFLVFVYGSEFWVMNTRKRSRIQAVKISFLCRVAGRTLNDRIRSSVTPEELRVELLLLHTQKSQLT